MTAEQHASVQALPTVEGKAPGIVGWDPCVLQCSDCGLTLEQDNPSVATFIIRSGFHFHSCEPNSGRRRCPDCLAAAMTACPNRRCKE